MKSAVLGVVLAGCKVVLEKDKGVPSSRLIGVIDRAKALGLKNFSMR